MDLMEYNGYRSKIEYDAEDSLFVGEVIGISDSLNFHGTSIDELKDNFHNCIDNYLSFCKSIGKNPEKEFKGSFNVRISPDLHKKITIEAARRKLSLNQFVKNALEQSVLTVECH